ncbi:hypothetical protein HK100_001019 [Physocladia obscura]|uniref:Uncharacterized protein n=1 Tax=Physocladia obscura TaxID=109957 RepID=A0AAD5SXQ8_9FUNG|nr:hypothetical protein HK100_001019 [Physocladia obscura]
MDGNGNGKDSGGDNELDVWADESYSQAMAVGTSGSDNNAYNDETNHALETSEYLGASSDKYDHLTLDDYDFEYFDPDAPGLDVWAAPSFDFGLSNADFDPAFDFDVDDANSDDDWNNFNNSNLNDSFAVDDNDAASLYSKWGGGRRNNDQQTRKEYVRDLLGDDAVARAAELAEVSQSIDSQQKPGRPFRVLIVGGGLGALCLAQSLKKVGIASRVFVQRNDVFGAAWSDSDHRLNHRISLSPSTLNALRHCLPQANFRALVYHQSTLLPDAPPLTSKVPYIGRFLTAYFYGIRAQSPYTRPVILTAKNLINVGFSGLFASPLSTHLFGKTKTESNSSQSLSVTMKTLRAVLLAGLDVITTNGGPEVKNSSNYHYFSSYAASTQTHDAEFGIASVWNHGKQVIRIDAVEPTEDGGKVGVFFEDGLCEVGDLAVDLREDVALSNKALDPNILWISGLFPLGNDKPISSVAPAKLLTNAAIIRSNNNCTLYTAPKHIVTSQPQTPTPHVPVPNSPVLYSSPLSRAPSRRVSYAVAGPRQRPRSILSVEQPWQNTDTSSILSQPIQASDAPRKPLRRPSNIPQQQQQVSKKSSRDSILSSTSNSPVYINPRLRNNSELSSSGATPPAPIRAKRPSFMSTRSRAGSLRRFGAIAGVAPYTATSATAETILDETPTHVHWRLSFAVELLATHTTAVFLQPDLVADATVLRDFLVETVRGGDIARVIAEELVRGWNLGVSAVIGKSVGVSVGVDAFGSSGSSGEIAVGGGSKIEGLIVEFRAGPTSLKPFDAPHDTNISFLISRIRDLSVTLEKSFSLTEIGSAPQIHSEERLRHLLAVYKNHLRSVETREDSETALAVRTNMETSDWFGVFGGIVVGIVKSIVGSLLHNQLLFYRNYIMAPQKLPTLAKVPSEVVPLFAMMSVALGLGTYMSHKHMTKNPEIFLGERAKTVTQWEQHLDLPPSIQEKRENFFYRHITEEARI